MAKRRLNKHQQIRIQENQEENKMLGEEGLITSHYGAYVDIELADRSILRCQLRQSLPPLVVGDRIIWQPVDLKVGVVVALLPRTSILYRPDNFGKIKAVAANVDQIIIVLAAQPEFSEFLLDCYLVAAELNEIKPLIVMNKIDLASATVENRLKLYTELNYLTYFISSKTSTGLTDLEKSIAHHVSVFVGQSGVGKSSLISHFVAEKNIAVGAISSHSQLGRHTTTTSHWYHLKNSAGGVIDSPGVREFGLGKINRRQLVTGFVELSDLIGECKFRDCCHQKEPHCALQAAFKQGKITPSRWHSFQKINESIIDE